MELNRAVDAPSNTGIAVYRQTFLSSDYVSRFPDREELVERLRIAIDDQVRAPSCMALCLSLTCSCVRFAPLIAAFAYMGNCAPRK